MSIFLVGIKPISGLLDRGHDYDVITAHRVKDAKDEWLERNMEGTMKETDEFIIWRLVEREAVK